jgi:hypothetical protein
MKLERAACVAVVGRHMASKKEAAAAARTPATKTRFGSTPATKP